MLQEKCKIVSRQHQSTGPSFVKNPKGRRKQNTVTLANAIKGIKKQKYGLRSAQQRIDEMKNRESKKRGSKKIYKT